MLIDVIGDILFDWSRDALISKAIGAAIYLYIKLFVIPWFLNIKDKIVI